MCLYRGPSGRMCAIGALIPDHEYNPGIESLNAYQAQLQVPALSDVDGVLLADLQRVHDSSDVPQWRSELEAIAKQHGLTMPEDLP